MDTPTKEDFQTLNEAVVALQAEVKSGRADQEKLEQISKDLDSFEEKFNQPMTQAAELAKTQTDELKSLHEKLEESGTGATEAKTRIEALELQLARNSSPNVTDYTETDEYKALAEYCVKGATLPWENDERKALLRTDVSADGGYLAPGEMDTALTKKITELDPIRSIARVRTISAKSLEMAIRTRIPVAEYEGEAETGTDDASTYENVTVVPYRQTFTVPITWDMLQDSAFSMESEITSDAAEAFAFGEGKGFVTGNGDKQPQGFSTHADLVAAARITAATGVLDPEALILLTGDLKDGYDPVYVLNRRTLALIRTFRTDAVNAADQAGVFLWAPNMNGPVASTINGFRYVIANSMADVSAGNEAVAFGDFRRAYTIIDRTGFSVIRDEVTQKRKAIVEFTINRWNTGQVTLQEPIKLLTIKT